MSSGDEIEAVLVEQVAIKELHLWDVLELGRL